MTNGLQMCVYNLWQLQYVRQLHEYHILLKREYVFFIVNVWV